MLVQQDWENVRSVAPREWKCGNCDYKVATRQGYQTTAGSHHHNPSICPCPNCGIPTFFLDGKPHPKSRPGDKVDHLPQDVARVYDQARDCCRIGAHDAAALLARTLLMHIAVVNGARPGEPFVAYVDYLEANHFIPPNSKDWVDHIRQQGNRAAHDIAAISEDDATELIDFCELLLRYLFEFPGRRAAKRAMKRVP